jgi:uncharacterized repeat protein (TIGR03803 family)
VDSPTLPASGPVLLAAVGEGAGVNPFLDIGAAGEEKEKRRRAEAIGVYCLRIWGGQDFRPGLNIQRERMVMGNLVGRFRILKPGLSAGATTAALALAMVFVLTVVTTGAAHAQSFQLLHTFTGPDGAQPNAGLTLRGSTLYGTTRTGHSGSNWGGAYLLRPAESGWVFQNLYIFDGTILDRVVVGPNGSLYGTSPNNIAGHPYGYVYDLRPPLNVCTTVLCSFWTGTVLYAFSGGSDGATPLYGDLIFDQSGNMYGTTSVGGTGNGVVYEMMGSGNNWTEQPLYAFAGSPDGANPYHGVIFDSTGNLYGTTAEGGATGNGAVFELSPNGSGGWTEQVLYSFQGGSDGNYPVAGVIFDQSGNLYGATASGGTGSGGTVFELSPSGSGWTHTVLYNFAGTAQCGPWGTLTLQGGNLYGTTVCEGANNEGNIFELTSSGSGWTYNSLYDFTGGNDGSKPYGNVIFNAAGDMFGTAAFGGSSGAGVVWEITP